MSHLTEVVERGVLSNGSSAMEASQVREDVTHAGHERGSRRASGRVRVCLCTYVRAPPLLLLLILARGGGASFRRPDGPSPGGSAGFLRAGSAPDARHPSPSASK